MFFKMFMGKETTRSIYHKEHDRVCQKRRSNSNMKKIFETNGVPFWTADEIALRNTFKQTFAREVIDMLAAENNSWRLHVHEVEGSILTPTDKINNNYTYRDVWLQYDPDNEGKMVLRPETTPSSYAYVEHLMDHTPIKPPMIVWQAGKSFRREQDQVSKNMRLKEFYQQEFQCFYTTDTMNDYQAAIMPKLEKMISHELGLPARVIESDRLPSYSRKTMDVEVNNGDKWMEICSVSVRTDFSRPAIFDVKKKRIEKEMLVLEIAIGLDRCVYNRKPPHA